MVDVWVKYVCVHAQKEWLQMWGGIQRLCRGGDDVHFTRALCASHEVPEIVGCFYGKRWCTWHERVFWKFCSRDERLKVLDCIKGNVNEGHVVHSSGCSVCLPWTSDNLFRGNGDANDMKECSGKSVVLGIKRLQMRGERQNVYVYEIVCTPLPGCCSVCIA